jgi:glycosyltransferase involved in cell wall biosynthesis
MERKSETSPEFKELPSPTDIFMVTRFSATDIGGIPSTVRTLTSQWGKMDKSVQAIRPDDDVTTTVGTLSRSENYRVILHHLDLHSIKFFMSLNDEQRRNCRVFLYQNIDRDSVIRNSKARNGVNELSEDSLNLINQGVEVRKWICAQAGVQTYAISTSIFENTINAQMVNPTNLHKIHIPIQETHYRNVTPEVIDRRTHDKKFRILCVSRVEPEKGISALFELQSELSENGNLAIDVAGSSNDQLYMDKMIERAKESNARCNCKINFMGQKSTDELVQIYSNSHILFSPSLIDTWGLSAVEGMAYGLPVVTFPSPGSIEIFSELHEQSGYIAENVAKSATIIRAISENRDMYKNLSYASLQNADLYSPQAIAQDILLKM